MVSLMFHTVLVICNLFSLLSVSLHKTKISQTFQTIGRVYNVHPLLMGELYYLQLLLHNDHSLKARSFSA